MLSRWVVAVSVPLSAENAAANAANLIPTRVWGWTEFLLARWHKTSYYIAYMKTITLMLCALLLFAVGSLARSQTIDELLPAFAQVESSNRAQVWGDNGKAYGLYQFHLPRWLECGGTHAEFGNTSALRQTIIMRVALTRYHNYAKRRGLNFVQVAATMHNIGHYVPTETRYVKKIKKELAH